MRPLLTVIALWMCMTASASSHALDAPSPVLSAPPPGAKPPAFRLGDAATPLAYAARLSIDPARTEFEGDITIDMRLNRPQDVLWLNGTDLVIVSAYIETGGRRTELAAAEGEKDFIGFAASEMLPAGDARLQVRYRGKLEGLSTRGLFRQQEGADWYVVSQFEALSARRAFPCFDEPGWKTPWQLTLDVPAGMVAASNSPIAEETPLAGDSRRVRFAPTAPLPSYLVALAVGPFDVVDGGTAGARHVALRYLAPRGRGAEMRYAKEITPRLVELLEDYFGMPYPFDKLDSVTIPQTVNFGAMENAGMITYASRLLMAKPYEESDSFRRRYAGVAAHEIAHQWFGDLVTLAWWDDIWLNESFATWLSSKTMSRFEPRWDDGWSRASARSRAITLDRLASTRRVRNPVEAQGDVINAFDAISYQKGGQVLAMFEAALTPERFRDGVRGFLKRHAFGSATAQDFVTALGESGKGQEGTVAAFRAFIEQPGAPLIDVALDCSAAPALVLNQARLRPAGSAVPGTESWLTPACFRYGQQGRVFSVCGKVPNGASRLALGEGKTCPAWVAANADGVGYYVARYDPALRAKLVAQARNVPSSEATAFVSDTAIMMLSGLMPIDAVLTLSESFAQHRSPVVRRAVAELLQELRDDWLDEAQRGRYAHILQRQIVPEALRLGWLEKTGASKVKRDAALYETRELRTVLLPLAADRGASLALQKEAAGLARRWLKKRDAVPAVIAEAALHTAATFADEALFVEMESEALATRERQDRTLLLDALVRARAPGLRVRALALALDERVGGRDAFDLLRAALEDDANRFAAFAYWRDHFDALVAKFPGDAPTTLIARHGGLCRADERGAFASFLGERSRDFPGGSQRYVQALERIDLCIAARAGNARQTIASSGKP